MEGPTSTAEPIVSASPEDEKTSSNESQKSSVETEKVSFPPPCLWYKTNAISARDDMWAYLSGQNIILVKPKITHTMLVKQEDDTSSEHSSEGSSGKGDPWPTFSTFGFQKDNYTCLNFCQSSWDYLPMKDCPLVTGCKGGFVRMWNVEAGSCVAYHDQHKNVPITCLDWSVRDPKIIYSMDEEGFLVSWVITKSVLKKAPFGKISPTSLQVSPHDDDLIAIGTKPGAILIVRTDPKGSGSCRVLKKLRHEEEVVATLWCPKLNSDFADPNGKGKGKDSILASSIQSPKSPSIRLWNSKGDDCGVYYTFRRADRDNRLNRHFSPLLWAVDPNDGSPKLLTSGKFGEILMFSQRPEESSKFDVVHDIHNHTGIFGLVQCGDIIWSISYEPVIIGWNLRTGSVSCVIPALKGVSAIVHSPIVRNLVGFGGSDGFIRVVDFQPGFPKLSSVKRPAVSNRMNVKIMAMAWHPKRDNWLGFGTDDGLLGYFELKADNKVAFQFSRRVSGIVYAVDWGPEVASTTSSPSEESKETGQSQSKNTSLCLYACGGSRVFSIHPSKRDNPLIDVSAIIHSSNPQSSRLSGTEVEASEKVVLSKASDIRWSPDLSILAVGYNDGKVELYTPPHLKLKCLIKCHSRAIQHLNWRPFDFEEMQNNPEHKQRWFATASNDSTIRLFNLESILTKEFLHDDSQSPLMLISSAATLRHEEGGSRVISTAWSPHNADLIVTVSYDNTAIVWNIRSASPIARYLGHMHRLVACAFHPMSPYEIITASDEFMHDPTVQVWDYRDHPFAEMTKPSKKVSGNPTPLYIKGSESKEEEENAEIIETTTNPGVERSGSGSVTQTQSTNQGQVPDVAYYPDACPPPGKQLKKKVAKKQSKSLLPSTANAFINQKLSLEEEVKHLSEHSGVTKIKQPNGDTANLTNGKEKEKSTTDTSGGSDLSMIHLGILGNYQQCVDLMKLECESHAEKGEWEKGCFLASWMGDTEFVEKAVEKGHVTEAIISIARTLSKQLFVRACTIYADKLVSQDEICKAATYLLLAGLKERAIQLLVQHKLYRDAVAMMNACTMKNNPVQMEVYKAWLKELIQNGNFEVAAKVYCSLGRYEDAMEVIERRDLPYAWKTGMLLADKCGNKFKLEVFGLKLALDGIKKAEHEEVKQTLRIYSDLNWLIPFVTIHECVFHLSNKLRDASKDQQETETIEKEYNLKDVLEKHHDLTGLSATKLKETLQVVIAQNRFDAEIMLTRTLAECVFESDEEKNNLSSKKEEYIQLCEAWLKEKDQYRHAAYMISLNSLM